MLEPVIFPPVEGRFLSLQSTKKDGVVFYDVIPHKQSGCLIHYHAPG
jgi:hypothetical protein